MKASFLFPQKANLFFCLSCFHIPMRADFKIQKSSFSVSLFSQQQESQLSWPQAPTCLVPDFHKQRFTTSGWLPPKGQLIHPLCISEPVPWQKRNTPKHLKQFKWTQETTVNTVQQNIISQRNQSLWNCTVQYGSHQPQVSDVYLNNFKLNKRQNPVHTQTNPISTAQQPMWLLYWTAQITEHFHHHRKFY